MFEGAGGESDGVGKRGTAGPRGGIRSRIQASTARTAARVAAGSAEVFTKSYSSISVIRGGLYADFMPTLSPEVTLRFLAAPTDVLMAGSHGVNGGRVLEWIDKAAYACAVGWSGTYCVTAYVGHIHFTRPIPSGHMVEVRSRIAMTGRSSMHIVNEVLSADPREGVFTRACDCLVIFVAKDTKTGKAHRCPRLTPH